MVSVRARLAIVVATVTAVVAAVVGYIFVALLDRSLERSVANELRAQSSSLVTRLREAPGPVPPAAGGVVHRPSVGGETMSQVLTEQGVVLEATGLAPIVPVLGRRALADTGSGPVWRDLTVAEDIDMRVLAVAVPRPDATVIAVVGASIEEQGNLIESVIRLLLASGVLLLVAAGAGTWWLAGAALKPVERLRRQVSTLSENDPLPRLEVPGTGDELAALAGTLNGLLSRLQRTMARERSLVADAGHELRTPLAVLQGELELAGRPGRSLEELREAVAAAAEEADRLSRLADSLLFLAADGRPQGREEVDLAAVVSAAAGRARAHAGGGVTVEVDADAGPFVVMGESESLRRAVENLVDNALGHAPPGSTVTVRAARQNERIAVEVLDEGPGFPDSFLPFAFERFRRADEARDRKQGGAGLGLSIVQAVAEAHGGTASVANRAGGGAVARMLLPARM